MSLSAALYGLQHSPRRCRGAGAQQQQRRLGGAQRQSTRPRAAVDTPPPPRRDKTVAMPRRKNGDTEPSVPPTPSGPDVRFVAGTTAAGVAIALLFQSPAVLAQAADTLEEFAKHFVIGGFAAAVGTAAVYPLDVLKTRMQVQPTRWTNALSCAREAMAQGGIPALYAGLGAQLVGVAPEKSVKIMAYNACHASLLATLGLARAADLPFAWEALAGGAAGAAQSLIACPLEAAKIPLQMSEESASGGDGSGARNRPTLLGVLRDLGFAGLFRGVDVCFARDIISGAVFFSCFAAAKHAVVDGMHLSPAEAQHAAFLTKLLAGAIAGVPSALLTTPLDVVKTRLQAQPGAESGSGAEGTKPYAGTWDCFVRTVEEDGWSALACGMGERVARLSPQLGITLALYEVLDPVRP